MPVRSGFPGSFRLDRRYTASICVFLGVLALSVAFFFLFGNSRVRRVFFFPIGTSGRIATEARFVPNHGDVEGDVREFIEGEILGPVDHGMKLLIPREVTLRSLFVRNRVLYLDLSADFAVLGAEMPLRGGDALVVLRGAVSFNFPRIREIVFLVDGQTPVYGQRGVSEGSARRKFVDKPIAFDIIGLEKTHADNY